MAEADPQASVLAKLTGLEIEKVQTALTIFVALLIEIGSGFGMYVAFAYWRTQTIGVGAALRRPASGMDRRRSQPSVRARVEDEASAQCGTAKQQRRPSRRLARRLNANDNRLPRGVPDSDVQRFYRERVVAAADSSSLTSTELYEEYCAWCEDNEKVPFAHPRVTREIGELGVKKERIGKRTRYFGIALRSASDARSDQEAAGIRCQEQHEPKNKD